MRRRNKYGLILTWLGEGRYQVDIETGEVKNRKGHNLKTYFFNKDRRKRKYVRLRPAEDKKASIKISVHRLVWVAATGSYIPEGWEVHHIDGNPRNNAFSNLVCVHPTDHLKLHRK